MDKLKDNTNINKLIGFVSKQTYTPSMEDSNRLFERVYSKTERTVSATFLITKHIPDIEPLKIKIRNLCLKTLESVSSMKTSMRNNVSEDFLQTEGLLREVISAIRIAAVSGYVSFENADVLSDAYNDVGVLINSSRRTMFSESVVLHPRDFEDVGVVHIQGAHAKKSGRYKDISLYNTGGDVSIRQGGNVHTDTHIDIPNTSNVSDIVARDDNNSAYQTNTPPPRETHLFSQTSRADAIISHLTAHGESGIKDIVYTLPEYSEKMIQRELQMLVQTGIVSKKGTKRWSTYVVNNIASS